MYYFILSIYIYIIIPHTHSSQQLKNYETYKLEIWNSDLYVQLDRTF